MATLVLTTLIQPAEIVNGGLVKPGPQSARFDPQLFAPHIRLAERRRVVPAIGSVFYEALKTAKVGAISNYNPAVGSLAPGFTLAAYETLWRDYLAEFCAWSVLYEAMPFIVMQAGSNGIYFNGVEQGQTVGVKGVQFLQDTINERLILMGQDMADYLCANVDALTGFVSTGICPDETCGDTPRRAVQDFGMLFYED